MSPDRSVRTVISFIVLLCLSACRMSTCLERTPGSYGYYKVREGAHTFWWKFPILGLSEHEARKAPLVLWIQGGPGASGVGFGNFEEIGPYGIGWKERSHTWARHANLLFVDSPVGTGFSYVTSNDSYATDNAQITRDLLSFLRQYLEEHDAQEQPLFIFSESYGGKVCSAFAEGILKEQEAGRIKVNLRGIALGDSWISAVDYVATWGDFLKAWSLLDDYQYTQLAPLLLETQTAVVKGELRNATKLWGQVEERIGNLTDNVDWYNALLHNIPDTEASLWEAEGGMSMTDKVEHPAGMRLLARHHSDPLTDFMREDVTRRLGIIPANVTWGLQSAAVFDHLAGDFMVDSIDAVDAVLAKGLPVSIYNGQLDLICSTLGLDAWLPKLAWPKLTAFQAARPKPLYAGRDGRKTTGFVRRHDNLALYIILNAGHMIPSDQPEVALDLLQRILETPREQVRILS